MNNLKDDAYYLDKILTDLRFIQKHMDGVSKNDLKANEVLFDSMSFRLVQVSENSKHLSAEFKASHATIPWVEIAGLRNRIVHDYGNVDFSVVYDTLVDDVPSLIEELANG